MHVHTHVANLVVCCSFLVVCCVLSFVVICCLFFVVCCLLLVVCCCLERMNDILASNPLTSKPVKLASSLLGPWTRVHRPRGLVILPPPPGAAMPQKQKHEKDRMHSKLSDLGLREKAHASRRRHASKHSRRRHA